MGASQATIGPNNMTQTNRDVWQARPPIDQSPRRGGDGRTRRSLAVGIPMLVFSLMAVLAIGFLVLVVGVFAAYSQGLPETSELDNLEFVSESIVYDRTGAVELARFNAGEAREPVTFEQIPPILMDATTAIEDR